MHVAAADAHLQNHSNKNTPELLDISQCMEIMKLRLIYKNETFGIESARCKVILKVMTL